MKLSRGRDYVYHFDVSIEPQSDYVVDIHRNLIVDFIGRYERLESDFGEACNRIGVPAQGCPTGDKRRIVPPTVGITTTLPHSSSPNTSSQTSRCSAIPFEGRQRGAYKGQ